MTISTCQDQTVTSCSFLAWVQQGASRCVCYQSQYILRVILLAVLGPVGCAVGLYLYVMSHRRLNL
jgi:hypothetical protein